MISFVILDAPEIPDDELERMYRLRYKVGVEDWGWSIPTALNRLDKDQFDTARTTYILVYQNDDELVACARLNPTIHPHLLSEIFPQHCDFTDVPQSKSIWELSRFMVDKDQLTHFQQVQLYLQMCLAVTKYAVEVGIEQLTWLSHKARYTKSVVVWKTRPLGVPRHYKDDDEEYIAAIMDTTSESVFRLRSFVKEDWSDPLSELPQRTSRRAA